MGPIGFYRKNAILYSFVRGATDAYLGVVGGTDVGTCSGQASQAYHIIYVPFIHF